MLIHSRNDNVMVNDADVSVTSVFNPETCPLMFPNDDDISQILHEKLLEVLGMDWEARPCLSRISVTKSVNNVIRS